MSKIRIIALLLLASLFGNAFAVSYYWGAQSVKREWLVERAALPSEIEERLPKELSAKRNELLPLVLQLRSVRQEMMQALVARPYDEARASALVAEVRQQTTVLQEAFQNVLLDIAKAHAVAR